MQIKYVNVIGLSDQEKGLARVFGRENKYGNGKMNCNFTVLKINIPYEKREDVPEQAKELWDMLH